DAQYARPTRVVRSRPEDPSPGAGHAHPGPALGADGPPRDLRALGQGPQRDDVPGLDVERSLDLVGQAVHPAVVAHEVGVLAGTPARLGQLAEGLDLGPQVAQVEVDARHADEPAGGV